jgi:putative methylase
MKQVQVERILQGLESIPAPRPEVEQYATPAGIAAEVLYLALGKGDVAGVRVLDAGCGAGVLGIGAKLLGAESVIGIDIDPGALRAARRNAERAHVAVDWRQEDMAAFDEPVDTVLTNPPFGSQRRHADRPFIDRSLQLGSVVYSFHNAVTEAYVRNRIEARGGTVTDRIPYRFPNPRAFPFHRDATREVAVVLFRTESNRPSS